MTTKLPVLFNASEAYNEEVLQCIKDTLKQKSGEITCKYEPTKAFIRDNESYITQITDQNKEWREKYNRRKRNLTRGFFADKAKAYQTVGKVYLESGDLIYSALTSDFRNKLVRSPTKYSTKWQKPGKLKKGMTPSKPTNMDKDTDPLNPDQMTAGYAALKKRLNEVKVMRRGVCATQSLYTYMSKKSIEMAEKTNKKEETEMKAPQKNQWKIVRAVGKIMGACRPKDVPLKQNAFLKSAFKKRGRSKNTIENDLDELESKEEILMRWRHEKKQLYLIHKLQNINSLLCAIYNMKHRMLKQHVPLSYKVTRDLFRQDIKMDQYNKPISTKPTQGFNNEEGINPSEPTTPESPDATHSPKNLIRKRISSVAMSNYGRRPRLAQLACKVSNKNDTSAPKIETWEELLQAGERNKKSSSLRSAGGHNKYSMKHGRRNNPSTPNVDVAPWTTVSNAEKTIADKKKAALLGFVSKRTAEDILDDIRSDFVKMQKQLTKEVENDMARQRNEQFKLLQSKFKTITLGPITNVALEKMRADSKILAQDRNDDTTKPMKWFMDLRDEVKAETALKNETINSILKRVSRFQYEDYKCIPFGKEKLCLLVLSMPIHILMTNSMLHAVLFVLVNILGGPAELMEIWLTHRKVTKISEL